MQNSNYSSELCHYGVKGMKWGIRRQAKRDAKEYARAKMFYGEGAGNRRKLIKATVKERSKDSTYKEEFDRQLAKQNMAKHASKAKAERVGRDVVKTTTKTASGLVNASIGNIGRISAGAATLYGLAHITGVDKVVAGAATKTIKDITNSARNTTQMWKAKEFVKKIHVVE